MQQKSKLKFGHEFGEQGQKVGFKLFSNPDGWITQIHAIHYTMEMLKIGL